LATLARFTGVGRDQPAEIGRRRRQRVDTEAGELRLERGVERVRQGDDDLRCRSRCASRIALAAAGPNRHCRFLRAASTMRGK
jgi:hypothetical protein